MRHVACLAVLICALAAAGASARTWIVPEDALTIQAGIDSAAAGDTVLVTCGVYEEFGLVMKSGICLRSETGSSDCATIDAQGLGGVFAFISVDSTARIEGFTVANGGSC